MNVSPAGSSPEWFDLSGGQLKKCGQAPKTGFGVAIGEEGEITVSYASGDGQHSVQIDGNRPLCLQELGVTLARVTGFAGQHYLKVESGNDAHHYQIEARRLRGAPGREPVGFSKNQHPAAQKTSGSRSAAGTLSYA